MLIYNLTIKLEPGIEDEWLKWMIEEHMPELMGTGLFTGHRLCRLLEQDEKEGYTFVVQYFCEGMEQYQSYISGHAQKMREKGFQRFGNRFVAFRTIMEELA